MSDTLRTNLRRQVGFVGRELELQEIIQALGSETRAWIISLTGVGGIGKTELAVQAAHLAIERGMFKNVIWTTAKESWLTPQGIRKSIADYALVSINELLDTAIDVLELNPKLYRVSHDRKEGVVRDAFREEPSLLIVDNLETVQDPQVMRFLERLPPPSKALVTTRFGALADSQQVIPAQTLEGQKEIRIGPLKESDAIDLYLMRAADHHLQYSRTNQLGLLQDAVKRAAYMPLAIEWIVSQIALRHIDLTEALESIQTSDALVLKYCFENLVATVGSRAAKVLMAVPAFADSASLDALEFVTAMNRNHQAEALRKLTSASLLELDENGRYKVLEPTRLYVRTMWRKYPELYRDYHLKAVEYYGRYIEVLDSQQNWSAGQIELHNVLYLLNWCFDNNYYEELVAFSRHLISFLDRLGLWDQRAFVCELGTTAALNTGQKGAAVDFSYHAAVVHKQRGRLDMALQEFQKCEEFSLTEGNKQRAAISRMQMGSVYYHKGQYGESIRILLDSLEQNRLHTDPHHVAINLSLLGRNELELGNYEMARQYFSDSLLIKAQEGSELDISIGQYDLGHACHLANQLEKAEQLLSEAVSHLERLKEVRYLSNAMWYHALLKIDRHELDAARHLLLRVLDIEERLQRDVRVERTLDKLNEVELLSKRGRHTPNGSVAQSLKTRVLLIGIEKYSYLGQIRDLRWDIPLFIDWGSSLSHKTGCELIILQDQDATAKKIRRILEQIAENSQPDELTLILFCGHALRTENRSYLCGADSMLNNLEGTTIESMELTALIQKIRSRDKVLLLDVQHHVVPNIDPHKSINESVEYGFPRKYLSYLASAASVQVISSADEDEISHKFPEMHNSLFAHYLVRGVSGEASLRGDNRIHLIDLFYYLENRIRSKTQGQTPQLYPETANLDMTIEVASSQYSTAESHALDSGLRIDESLQGLGTTAAEIDKIRELVISAPLKGAKLLSEFLAEHEPELQNRVDLYRTELFQLNEDRLKYGELPPALASQWSRRIYDLLEICQSRWKRGEEIDL